MHRKVSCVCTACTALECGMYRRNAEEQAVHAALIQLERWRLHRQNRRPGRRAPPWLRCAPLQGALQTAQSALHAAQSAVHTAGRCVAHRCKVRCTPRQGALHAAPRFGACRPSIEKGRFEPRPHRTAEERYLPHLKLYRTAPSKRQRPRSPTHQHRCRGGGGRCDSGAVGGAVGVTRNAPRDALR